jgi:hypothetical protein
LSDTVGSYDRLRQQDQISIQKLRERVQQLDSEKNAGMFFCSFKNDVKRSVF